MTDILKAIEPPVEPVKSARLRAIESNSARQGRAAEFTRLLQDPKVQSIAIKASSGHISKIILEKGKGAAIEYLKNLFVTPSADVGKDQYMVVSAADLAAKRLAQAFPDKLDYGDKELHWSFASGEHKQKAAKVISDVKLYEKVGDEAKITAEVAQVRREEEDEDEDRRPRRRAAAAEPLNDVEEGNHELGLTADSAGAFENAKNAWGAGKYYMDPKAGIDHTAYLPRFKEGGSPFDKETVKILQRDYKYDPNKLDEDVSQYNLSAKKLNDMTRKDTQAIEEYTRTSEKRQQIMQASRDFAKAADSLSRSGGRLAAALDLARDRGDVLDRRADSASAFPPRSLDRR